MESPFTVVLPATLRSLGHWGNSSLTPAPSPKQVWAEGESYH